VHKEEKQMKHQRNTILKNLIWALPLIAATSHAESSYKKLLSKYKKASQQTTPNKVERSRPKKTEALSTPVENTAVTETKNEVVRDVAEVSESESKFSAFVDIRYLWNSETPNQMGFFLNDAALQWNFKKGQSQLVLDLPFFADSNNLASTAVVFGATKAQAFGKIDLSSEMNLQVGQFDTIYGFDLNDTKDNFFAQQGLVNGLLPVVHVGVLSTWTHGSTAVKFLLANPADMGHLDGMNPEGGAQISYGFSDGTFVFGVLGNKQGDVSTLLLDTVVGYQVSKDWKLDFEWLMKRITDEDSTQAFLLQNVYSLSPDLGLGLRAELPSHRKY